MRSPGLPGYLKRSRLNGQAYSIRDPGRDKAPPTQRRVMTDFLYRLLRLSRDVNAVRRGPKAVGRRIARRAYGRATGRLAGKLFR
jgi:hypothetical protein